MAATDHERIVRKVLDAWNAHDVERVVACYTPDLVYRDPGTRGEVRGADALRRYLTKMFASWRMHWSPREVFPLGGTNGAADPRARRSPDLRETGLVEVTVEREGIPNVTAVKHGEGDGVAQRPVLVGVLREDFLGALLFGG